MALVVDFEKKLSNFTLKAKFSCANQEVLTILGASGSGKSMILKCIAGVEKPDQGKIILNDRVLFDSSNKINLTPQERRIGILFQNYALFPHMTVEQNILYSIRKNYSNDQKFKIAKEILNLMQLIKIKDQLASKISGGEMQRVALARILVNDADLMMLDEPFSAIDEYLKFSLELELRERIKNFAKPVLFVTHDRDQAYRIGDRIALIYEGKINKVATPKEIFVTPETVYNAKITGVKNIAPAIYKDGKIYIENWQLSFAYDPLKAKDLKYVGIRMNDFKLASHLDDLAIGTKFIFKIDEVFANVFTYTVKLKTNAEPLFWQVSKDLWDPYQKSEVELYIKHSLIMILKE